MSLKASLVFTAKFKCQTVFGKDIQLQMEQPTSVNYVVEVITNY